MKKFNKVMTALFLVVAVFAFVTPVFADTTTQIIDTDLSGLGTDGIGVADAAVGKAWNTVRTILQVLAIAAVVFAGVRYMFASADQKADIKKSMGILAIGAALVFGATFIIDFIVKIAGQVTGQGV